MNKKELYLVALGCLLAIGANAQVTIGSGQAPNSGTLLDREGNDYHIATFGVAGTWMTENLRTKTAPGLVVMTESAANSTTDMYYAYPNGGNPYVGQPSTWTAQQGLLYNWSATMNKIMCGIDQGHGTANELTVGPRVFVHLVGMYLVIGNGIN